MRTDLAYLQDILAASEKIGRFVDGPTLDDFVADERTQSAVIREITVMGEAAARIPRAVKDAHASIPWDDLVQLRNFYIHVYHCIS